MEPYLGSVASSPALGGCGLVWGPQAKVSWIRQTGLIKLTVVAGKQE